MRCSLFKVHPRWAVTAVALLLSVDVSQAQVKWPVVTQQAKPWTRWWWEGSAVNAKDLTWNMESYRAAGLGGLEITPIYGIKGYEKEFIPFLSAKWVDMLQHTLKEGKRLDLGIDLANATGWPFGGPWVSDADASKELFWKTYTVKGGETPTDLISFTQQRLVRSEARGVDTKSVVQPLLANKDLQLLALDQVRYERQLPLTVLMAYGDNGQKLNLTSQVTADGKLDWIAPKGANWQLYALFQGDHGKMVERAAPGGEGFVIDHFSKPALNNYLLKFDQAFKGRDLSGLRGYFNDSYEVDDAQGQSNITPQLFKEFIKRRGYDLRDHLPALFGKADKEMNSRVICDYRETISDLLLDNFTKPWHDWGKSHKALIRNQSHGSPANILDLYAAIDIPETEGYDVLRFKFATSAAHVTGKPLASSESATWLKDHFLASLGDVKQAIDQFFIGGVNHVFYHGVSYSPESAPWPGWLFYASVHFNQTNPFWDHFSALNKYIAHCQSFLQQGKPSNDVLVYYPVFDSFSEPGNALLKHYDAMRPDFNGSNFAKAAEWMQKKGYGFDFISDKQILKLQNAGGGKLLTGGNSYRTIMLPGCKYIPANTMSKIVELAHMGATVVVYNDLPTDVPGFGALAQRQKALQQLTSSLKWIEANGIKTASIGKGKFVLASDLGELLSSAGVASEIMTEMGLQFTRRVNGSGYSYFISNSGSKAIEGWVPLSVKAAAATIYDSMHVQAGLASIKMQNNGTSVYLQLQPGESCIVQTADHAVQGKAFAYYQTSGTAVELSDWTLTFTKGGPTIPAPISMKKPALWTSLNNADADHFSGIGSYSTLFAKPKAIAKVYQLDLGKVSESAEVYLNGSKVGTLIGPQYKVNIPVTLLKASNKLEVRVANSMANRIIDMEKKGQPYKKFYNTNFPAHDRANLGTDGLFTAVNWQPRPSGIEGKVTLTPLVVADHR